MLLHSFFTITLLPLKIYSLNHFSFKLKVDHQVTFIYIYKPSMIVLMVGIGMVKIAKNIFVKYKRKKFHRNKVEVRIWWGGLRISYPARGNENNMERNQQTYIKTLIPLQSVGRVTTRLCGL